MSQSDGFGQIRLSTEEITVLRGAMNVIDLLLARTGGANLMGIPIRQQQRRRLERLNDRLEDVLEEATKVPATFRLSLTPEEQLLIRDVINSIRALMQMQGGRQQLQQIGFMGDLEDEVTQEELDALRRIDERLDEMQTEIVAAGTDESAGIEISMKEVLEFNAMDHTGTLATILDIPDNQAQRLIAATVTQIQRQVQDFLAESMLAGDDIFDLEPDILRNAISAALPEGADASEARTFLSTTVVVPTLQDVQKNPEGFRPDLNLGAGDQPSRRENCRQIRTDLTRVVEDRLTRDNPLSVKSVVDLTDEAVAAGCITEVQQREIVSQYSNVLERYRQTDDVDAQFDAYLDAVRDAFEDVAI